jgi:hypothetical protein
VEEVVRDDVEAMELGWVKIEYVDDFEGPALRPRGCGGVVALLRETRELVRTFALLFDEMTLRGEPRIAESEGWCPGGGYIASGTIGMICSGGCFLGGFFDTLDGMVG